MLAHVCLSLSNPTSTNFRLGYDTPHILTHSFSRKRESSLTSGYERERHEWLRGTFGPNDTSEPVEECSPVWGMKYLELDWDISCSVQCTTKRLKSGKPPVIKPGDITQRSPRPNTSSIRSITTRVIVRAIEVSHAACKYRVSTAFSDGTAHVLMYVCVFSDVQYIQCYPTHPFVVSSLLSWVGYWRTWYVLRLISSLQLDTRPSAVDELGRSRRGGGAPET